MIRWNEGTMQKQSTMLKRKPARYVNNMAREMAQGALISGFEILDRQLELKSLKGQGIAYSSVICAVAS